MPSETPTPGEKRASAGPAETPTSVKVMRNIDVPVLAIALVVFVAAGFPLLGWVTGAGAWAIQRAIAAFAAKKAKEADDPRTKVGLLAGSMIGRGWLVAGIIIAVGLGNNEAGLSAAVLFLITFTAQFTMTLAMRPFDVAASKGPAK
jgi:predicted lipid-binding transport protein (Tim44 family)